MSHCDKIRKEKESKKISAGQRATAAGGSAINTSLFVQNSIQVRLD